MESMDLDISTEIPKAFHSGYYLSPEIWRLVGEQIQCQTTLSALVRTNRTFRDIFLPVLHDRRTIYLHRYQISGLDQQSIPPRIPHARQLEIILGDSYGAWNDYDVGTNNSLISYITRIVKGMPHLQSFKWADFFNANEFNTVLIVSDVEIVRALKTCHTLKSFSIQFSRWPGEKGFANKCWIALEGFRNLKSLEIYNFYGTEANLIKDITSVLVDSPRLKTLGLGLLCHFDSEEDTLAILEGECKFLENLCLRFYSQKALPLKLHTLRLGTGMCLFESSSVEGVDFLAKLVDFSGLRCLHVFNDDYDGRPRPHLQPNWDLLAACTDLQQLSISRLEEGAIDWLSHAGKSVQELIITYHYGLPNSGLNLLNRLILSDLMTLYVHEGYVARFTNDDAWPGTDTSATESPDEDLTESGPNSLFSIPKDGDSAGHTSADSDSLERKELDRHSPRFIAEELRTSTMSILDQLHDGGSKLKRLNLCLDLKAQFDQFASHLPHLRCLTQLCIAKKDESYLPGRFPPKTSSLWPGVQNFKEIAIRYAKLIHLQCPSLQYIKIGSFAWHFIMQYDTTLSEISYDSVRIRELQWEEIRSFELFGFEEWPTSSGLLGPEYFSEEPSEEEWDLREKRDAESNDSDGPGRAESLEG